MSARHTGRHPALAPPPCREEADLSAPHRAPTALIPNSPPWSSSSRSGLVLSDYRNGSARLRQLPRGPRRAEAKHSGTASPRHRGSSTRRRGMHLLRNAGLQNSGQDRCRVRGVQRSPQLSAHSGSVLAALEADLAGYEHTKGSLHFPIHQPLPPALVIKLITTRLAQLGWTAELTPPTLRYHAPAVSPLVATRWGRGCDLEVDKSKGCGCTVSEWPPDSARRTFGPDAYPLSRSNGDSGNQGLESNPSIKVLA
jgi:hypothetical protein